MYTESKGIIQYWIYFSISLHLQQIPYKAVYFFSVEVDIYTTNGLNLCFIIQSIS